MRIEGGLSDDAILRELGERIAHARLERNLTQATLAESAGVSKRTIERLESGRVAAQLSVFVRVLRALGAAENLNALLPEWKIGPMAQLETKNRERQRASRKKSAQGKARPWTWGKSS